MKLLLDFCLKVPAIDPAPRKASSQPVSEDKADNQKCNSVKSDHDPSGDVELLVAVLRQPVLEFLFGQVVGFGLDLFEDAWAQLFSQ